MVVHFNNIAVIAQLLIGFYYAFYGFWNIYHWTPIISAMMRDNIPHPYLWLSMCIFFQVLLGCLIMFNLFVKTAASILIPFTLLAAIIFHPFWRYKGELRILNFSNFMAQTTIAISALLFLIANSI